MKRYLVLYRAEGALTGHSVTEMFATSTPEQMAAGMAAWRAWYEGAAAGVADLGAPLDKATILTGGSHAAEKTTITGYSILQAESIDEAIALLKGHPSLSHAWVVGAGAGVPADARDVMGSYRWRCSS